MIGILDTIMLWSIAAVPMFVAIAPAPASVFMWFAIVCFLVKKIITRTPLMVTSQVIAPLLLFFAVTCLSTVHSINLADSFRGGIFRLLQFCLLLFAVASEVKEKKDYWRILIAIAAGLSFLGIDSIWQVATGKDLVRAYAPVVNLGLVRATASFKDSNTLGVYLSALAPLTIGLSLYYLRGKQRIVMALVALLAATSILLTYSRPTLLALYCTVLLFALLKKTRLLIVGLLVIACLSPFLLPKSIKQWAKAVDYNPVRFMCNDDRIAIYRNTMHMIKAHPVIGLGANTYMKNYRFYKEVPEYRNVVTIDYAYAHNSYLQLTAETGFLGLGIFIWLLIAVFKEGAAILKKQSDPFLLVYALSLIVCIAAFLINSLTESSLYYSRVAVIFWYLLGLLVSIKGAGAMAQKK